MREEKDQGLSTKGHEDDTKEIIVNRVLSTKGHEGGRVSEEGMPESGSMDEGQDDARRIRHPLLYSEEVFEIIGAAMEVHRELKSGFREAVYQEALEMEMTDRGIPFEVYKPLRIQYKARTLKKEYAADLVCYGKIIVEIKALSRLSGIEEAQVLNYLKVSGLKVGLLVNFGSTGRLEWKRYIH